MYDLRLMILIGWSVITMRLCMAASGRKSKIKNHTSQIINESARRPGAAPVTQRFGLSVAQAGARRVLLG
jgi:hypothetical protein